MMMDNYFVSTKMVSALLKQLISNYKGWFAVEAVDIYKNYWPNTSLPQYIFNTTAEELFVKEK